MSRSTPRRLFAVLAVSTAVLLVPGLARARGGGDDGGAV